MRCDVNVSVRPAGEEKLGTRTEIKNMNSFTFIEKAVAYEVERQIDLLESGEEVVQETRRYDDARDVTESMRGKEDANDYRYFREPDLVTIATAPEEIESIRAALPELPDSRYARYTGEWGIPAADTGLLVKYRKVAEYFEEAAQGVTPKTAANFILGQIFRRLVTDADKEACEVSVPAAYLRELVALIDSGKLKMNLAKSTLEKMLDTGKPVGELLTEEDMAGVDEGALRALCEEVAAANPGAVADYRGGKEKALKALLGGVMKATRGAADAQTAERLLKDIIARG